MAKRKKSKSDDKTTLDQVYMCLSFDDANWMVEQWLDAVSDRASGSEWLGQLFKDGWEVAGISEDRALVMDREGPGLLLLKPDTLKGEGIMGIATPPHSPCPNGALSQAVRAAALQPVMKRAVGGPASPLRSVPFNTPWGADYVKTEV
jgi:hypothetical protein